MQPTASIFQKKLIREVISLALREDIGQGDVTSHWILRKDLIIKGRIVAHEEGVIAGLQIASQVFLTVDKHTRFINKVKDGSTVLKGTVVAIVGGPAVSILSAERTALNFLQRMSGIATMTRQLVQKIRKTKARILDTRKTAPGLRSIDKLAVYMGGGQNHRFGLYDMVLIKDNHIKSAGSISRAIQLIQKRNHQRIKVEVEVENLTQLKEVLSEKIDIIMLDNMSFIEIKKAVAIVNGKFKLEVSGGINNSNILQIAQTGVDYISIGGLTHSVKALDLSLDIL
ncbi:nicotinate-nucleotide diphosphorylase (carboxylating) [Candidatus Roizmanbacteria bacterium RIFCSPHIGHO2_12_FULL_41_11]|uniref:Probable nicotinate-nucleotide pyrophosphorylase [carboxylating] n=1 Tax=Candidatus Roizmanbacteria bacterium RIFCSPHIGHO2_12_FULL_41_11 TaxID=1802052 RepID=A0A1F7I2Z0_9BACT|nr:MAG: nicotinate-nucleotide diphosphorylase (carboxylating) [Candidatus Roizmanbacteria bacterium RIFCSPHIGHO2_12_FULL_41_11]